MMFIVKTLHLVRIITFKHQGCRVYFSYMENLNGERILDHYEAKLPIVTQEDISLLILPEILDPSHAERWEQFAHEQRNLARETRNRLTMTISDIAARKVAIDEVSYVYLAIRQAVSHITKPTIYTDLDTPLFDYETISHHSSDETTAA